MSDAPDRSARTTPVDPVGASQRVELLDVIRGVAILGILLVNMQTFFAPIYVLMGNDPWWTGQIDQLSTKLIAFFAQGKFYTMFSFLFGIGAAVQLRRTTARGRRFGRFFARRMFWLLLIGLVHAFLVWFGDILVFYSLIGFVLILFARCRFQTLAIWTVVLFLVPLALMAGFFGEVGSAGAADIDLQEQAATARLENAELAEQALRAYSGGSYSDVLAARFGEWWRLAVISLLWSPNILAMFLIGLNVGRRDLPRRIADYLPALRRWLPLLLSLGLLTNAIAVALTDRVDPNLPSALLLVQIVCATIGGPALCFTYVIALTLLFHGDRGRRFLAPLAAVGRMALTNYLIHSVVFTTLANGYGFGLYGQVSPSLGLLLTFATFLVQVPLSNWWLGRFRFGPLEWLWRSLTYGSLQPFRRAASSTNP